MNFTAWVDVAIGLGLVYLGASLLVTIVNEYIAQALNLRGRQLRASLKDLITDESVKGVLSRHPAIQPFFGTGKKWWESLWGPSSYVDPNVLGRLLVGGLAAGAAAGDIARQFSSAVDSLADSGLKAQLQALVRSAGSTADGLVAAASDWVDRSLTMLGEGYKGRLQLISLGVGLAVAVGLNLDTVALTTHLYRDKEAREAAATLAERITEKTDKEAFDRCLALTPQKRTADASCAVLAGLVEAVRGRNETLGKLPIGWGASAGPAQGAAAAAPFDWGLWATRAAGWLLTAFALSLGAPFWFDVLNKLVNMRHGMRRPEVKGEKTAK